MRMIAIHSKTLTGNNVSTLIKQAILLVLERRLIEFWPNLKRWKKRTISEVCLAILQN